MKVRTYKDKKTGKVGIALIAECCCEEETLITDLLNKKIKIVSATDNPFATGIALVMDEDNFSQFSGLENSKGKRSRLNPYMPQTED